MARVRGSLDQIGSARHQAARTAGLVRRGASDVPSERSRRAKDMPQVVVIEGEDAAPEAVRPTVALLDRLRLDLRRLRPAMRARAATRPRTGDGAPPLVGA